jgi:hypothetical protein
MPIFSGAADAFAPLSPGSYPGEIEPGAFVDHFVRNGNRHGALGLRLDIGEQRQRVVRVQFLLESETALAAAKRDAETLESWAELICAARARDWFDLVRNLWLGQRRLGVGLIFDLRPADRNRGYILLDVKPDF